MENSEGPLDSFINKNKLPIGMGVVGLVLVIGGIVSSGIIPKTFIKSSKSLPARSATDMPTSAKVDVSGAVVNPGVYTLPSLARIEDALKAAGGVTVSADSNYMSKTINLAQKVSDGMKIYIPTNQDKSGLGQSQITQPVASPSLVNINEATISELDQLPGVGEVTAKKIIDGRPYQGVEELLTKKAVTRSTYDKIKEMVTVW